MNLNSSQKSHPRKKNIPNRMKNYKIKIIDLKI